MFSIEIGEIFKKTYFQEHLRMTVSGQTFRNNGIHCKFRKSRLKVFYEKGVLRNFTKFTGKHLSQRPAALLKRHSGTGVFLWILRNFLDHLFYRTPLDDCFWKLKRFSNYEFKLNKISESNFGNEHLSLNKVLLAAVCVIEFRSTSTFVSSIRKGNNAILLCHKSFFESVMTQKWVWFMLFTHMTFNFRMS